MHRIVLGQGSAYALVGITTVPSVGDKITVNEDQIVWTCGGGLLIVGGTLKLTEKAMRKIEGEEIPCFEIEKC